jgi:hypothetical protein
MLSVALAVPGMPQQTGPPTPGDLQATVQALVDRLAAAEARIDELEGRQKPGVARSVTASPAISPIAALALVPAPALAADTAAAQTASATGDPMGTMMEIPGGPTLKIRGFFDFNYGVGSIANPLIFPVGDGACGTCGNPSTPAHNSFQAGEFDLFITSKLSDNLSFIAEVLLGPDNTNVFGPDIERYQLTYKANPYFSASVGRFHTSIGYYNTAYHHGTWFSTAEGRPIMYLFEDSGGILPVHMVAGGPRGRPRSPARRGLGRGGDYREQRQQRRRDDGQTVEADLRGGKIALGRWTEDSDAGHGRGHARA